MLFPHFGKLISLTIMDYGLYRVHENGRLIGIPGFLLQTDRGKNILVDTGFPAKYAQNPQQANTEDGLDEFGEVVSLTAENLPAAQLAKVGLTADQIDLVVYTHTDVDHVGGLHEFANLPIVLGREDRAQPKPRYYQKAPFDWPEAEYQLIDEDIDLFSGVRLLTTPGHAPGHLSLLLTLPEKGAVLLTGDAISRPAEIEERFETAWDPAMAIRSANKLMTIAADTGARVIYGHDPEQWPKLKKAPNNYQ